MDCRELESTKSDKVALTDENVEALKAAYVKVQAEMAIRWMMVGIETLHVVVFRADGVVDCHC